MAFSPDGLTLASGNSNSFPEARMTIWLGYGIQETEG